MMPFKAAFQLSKVWREIQPANQIYPVDCKKLAKGIGLKVHGDSNLGDEFEAGLFIDKGLKKGAIVYNTQIREEGRKNFSIAHELGHYSCHKDLEEIPCSIKDLNDFQSHPQNIEQEANFFAATLLMPADDFRKQFERRDPTLQNVSEVKNRYATTITATAVRLLWLSNKPLAIVRIREGKISSCWLNDSMKQTGLFLRCGTKVLADIDDNLNGEIVESDLWLPTECANNWEITQSTINMPYYKQTLVMLCAEPKDVYMEIADYADDKFNPRFY